jgi:hypothetical protein
MEAVKECRKKEEFFAVVVEAGYREREGKAGAHGLSAISSTWARPLDMRGGIFTRHTLCEKENKLYTVRVDLASGAAAARGTGENSRGLPPPAR